MEVRMYTNPISVITQNIVIAACEERGNTLLLPALFIKNKNLLECMHLHKPPPLESNCEILNFTITYLLCFWIHIEIPMYFISAYTLYVHTLQEHLIKLLLWFEVLV